jgi:hypothetical protein
MPASPPPVERVNGGPPGRVIPLARQQPEESWQLMRQWADQHGWGSFRCAGAMILAATPAERKRLPEQQTLAGHWRRWLKGEHIPDAHMSDPNARGFYRPIIARMMGTTPDKIWPARKSAHTTADAVQGELRNRRARTAGTLAEQYRKLDDLRRQVQLIPQLEDGIRTLEDELRYLDAMLAVPVPDEPRQPHCARTAW